MLNRVVTSTVAIGILGCSDIVIKVNKKSKDSSTSEIVQNHQEKSSSDIDIQDVYAYLQEVDEVKKDATDWLLQELKDGKFRPKYRKALRSFRDSIIRNAQTTHSYRNDLFAVLNELTDLEGERCTTLQKTDLTTYQNTQDLTNLITGALFSNISSYDPKVKSINFSNLDQDLIGVIEQFFNMEMGVDIKDGSYSVTDSNSQKQTSRSLIWKVITEEDEKIASNTETYVSEESRSNDDLAVKLTFTRTTVNDVDRTFILEALVGKGLYEDNPVGDQYYLTMSIDNMDTDNIDSLLENGTRNGEEKIKSYSRKMSYVKESKEKFKLIDIVHFNLDGEDEETRIATIDFEELKKCLPNDQQNLDETEEPSATDGSDEGSDNSDDNTGDTEDPTIPEPPSEPTEETNPDNNGDTNDNPTDSDDDYTKDDDENNPENEDENPPANDSGDDVSQNA